MRSRWASCRNPGGTKPSQSGRRGRRWLPGAPEVDWASASPHGRYVGHENLFRASVYLDECLDRMGYDARSAFAARCDAVRAATAPFGHETTMASLLGATDAAMPGLLGRIDPEDARDREILRHGRGPWWQRLTAVHSSARRLPPASLRGAMLDVAHALAVDAETAVGEPWLHGVAGVWRGRWLDLADYTYVAVREFDVGTRMRDIGGECERPRLLAEPLPHTFAALGRAFALVKDPAGERSVHDLQELLSAQRSGREPDPAAVERLWAKLLTEFREFHMRPLPTRLEGLDGAFRRRGPFLVRLPIVWEGRRTSAVAFDWYVEHEVAPSSWERARRSSK